LLHGYSDNAGTWRPLLRELATRGRRALAVDLPGFGEADRLAGYPDRFADGPLLGRIDSFIGSLVAEVADAGPPVIVGNSLGGVAGLRAAQDGDLRLAGTVAISPAGLGHQPWVDFFEREPLLHRILSAPVPVPGELIRLIARVLYSRFAVANGTDVDGRIGREYASQYRSREDVTRIVRDARRVLAELHDAYDLTRLCHPVLLLWGDRDPLTPLRGAQRLLDAAPETELVVFEGCGHCAHVEQPARVADRLCDVRKRSGSVAEANAQRRAEGRRRMTKHGRSRYERERHAPSAIAHSDGP
jgi:pimeloyl-ACP methyl ester carboxylesterase